MSNLVNKLFSGGGLLRTAVLGAALGFSMATQAANVDAPVAQAETFDALVGFTAVPLSVAESETLDAERIRFRVKVFGVKIGGPISFGSKYRCPHAAAVNCIVVPTLSRRAPCCFVTR